MFIWLRPGLQSYFLMCFILNIKLKIIYIIYIDTHHHQQQPQQANLIMKSKNSVLLMSYEKYNLLLYI